MVLTHQTSPERWPILEAILGGAGKCEGLEQKGLGMNRIKTRRNHHSRGLTHLVKGLEKSHLQLAVAMIICFVRLQDAIEAFEQKRPEAMQRAEVLHRLCCVRAVVMIGPHHWWAV